MMEEKKQGQGDRVRFGAMGIKYHILTGSSGYPSADFRFSYRGTDGSLVVPEESESSGNYNPYRSSED